MKTQKPLASILIMFLLYGCNPALYKSVKWQETAIRIDGIASDWNDVPNAYDKNSKLMYEIRNDEDNMYLAVRTTDQFSQMKILNGGLRLGLDTSNAKKYPSAIVFPWHEKGSPIIPMNMEKEGEPTKVKLESMHSSILIDGFGKNDGNVDSASDNVIEAAIGGEIGDYFFLEFKIPFITFIGNPLNADDTVKVISMELVLPLLEMPDGTGAMDPGREGGPPSGFPSGPPPDMGGGNGPPPMSMGSTDFGKKTLRIRFHPVFQRS